MSLVPPLLCTVAVLCAWQLPPAAAATDFQLPPECDTPDEQGGAKCQAVCGCDCTDPKGQCQQVCSALGAGGLASLPWCTDDPCDDDDEGFVAYMKSISQWNVGITTCVDAPSCVAEIVSFCGCTCKDGEVTLELPWADDADPVQVYMSAGQSNCAGSASAELMKEDGAHPKLFEANTTKSKIWFAGLTRKLKAPDSFGITALWAGAVGDKHGPEVAIGHRLQELTGRRVLIFKYCMGGTSAKEDWNPDWGGNGASTPPTSPLYSDGNAWDKSADTGKAAFLKDLRMGNPKQQQYLRFTYNLRLMREQLDAADVAFEFKGIFWRQSSADQDSTWQQYGADQIRLFNAMRAEVEEPDLPIIFEGDSGRANLQGGKVYAAKVLCHATVGVALTAQLDPASTCTPMIADPCTEDQVFSGEMQNQFGWDVDFPELNKVPRDPDGFSAATSKWVVRYQYDPATGKAPNMHDQYDGMWWNGIAMANAYVREHTSGTVPLAMSEWDIWAKWPASRCSSQNKWSADPINLCWEDASTGCQDDDPSICTGVTAESCRATEAHYTACPCACQEAATCTAEPAAIDPATLTYYPEVISECGPALDEACPDYAAGTPAGCRDCAIANKAALGAAECTVATVGSLCMGATQGARISAPDMQASLAILDPEAATEPEPEPEPEPESEPEEGEPDCASHHLTLRRGKRLLAGALALAACVGSTLP